MTLQLNGVIPDPLQSKVKTGSSAVWLQEVTWTCTEYIFVRAPSGTGKTTLMHLLYGLRKDYNGTISWDSQNITSMNADSWADTRSRDVSLIFQDLRLLPHLTAWENLEIKRVLTNYISVEEVTELMRRLGIADKRDSLARTMSYGEQQRLSIIRALLQPFKWILMDEPFSHLDEANKLKAAALIQEMVVRNGASLLMADLDDNDYFPYTQKLLL